MFLYNYLCCPSHCAELLVNTPEQCAVSFLFPGDVQVMPTLRPLYPDIYDCDGLYASNLDCVCDDWNMCAVLSLINYLHWQLVSQVLKSQTFVPLSCRVVTQSVPVSPQH